MNAAELVSRVRDLGINLWVEGDDLRYSAPKGALTQDLRAELVAHKAEILAFLRETQAVAPPSQTDEAEPEPREPHVVPRTPTEETLAKIWAEVLGVEQVGIHDNFFELGGDSLLGLQVITSANQAGLRFVPRQLLEHQTIAELAAVEGTAPVVQAEQGLVTGPVVLTNNQQWFFDMEFQFLHYWNVSRLLEVPETMDPALVEQVVRHLLVHHDALRTYLIQKGSSRRAFIAPPKEEVPFILIDISGLPAVEHGTAIEQAVAELQQEGFNLSEEPLLRVALFDLGTGRPKRLLVVVHHIVADAGSMAILLEDFQTAYQQLSRGEPIQLPPKTTSVKQWAEQLHAHAQSVELRQEMDYWLNLPWVYSPLPLDYPEAKIEDNIGEHRGEVRMVLSAEETSVLLREVPKVYKTQILDALLMALVEAVTQWTGGRWLPVIVLDSGRGALFGTDDMDLSRTVGLFATNGFMILEREEAINPEDVLKSIKEQVRRIPNQGLGFELLLRCSEDTEIVEKLGAMRKNDVRFNYLGQFDTPQNEPDILFRPAQESQGEPISLQNKCDELLYCQLYVWGDRLCMKWYYGTKFFKHATVERVAQDFVEALRALITHIAGHRESINYDHRREILRLM